MPKMEDLAGSLKCSFGDEDVGNSSKHYGYFLSSYQVARTTPKYFTSVISLNPLRAADALGTVSQAQHRKQLAPFSEWDSQVRNPAV